MCVLMMRLFEKFWPGKYVIVASEGCVVTENASVESIRLGRVPVDQIVDVTEIVEIKEEDRIRGKMINGGWVSMCNTKSGYCWLQVRLFFIQLNS